MSRYKLVPYSQLSQEQQRQALMRYPHLLPWLPAEEYHYPVKKDGKLANAGRHVPLERAKELKDAYDVRKVMES